METRAFLAQELDCVSVSGAILVVVVLPLGSQQVLAGVGVYKVVVIVAKGYDIFNLL